jgi:hypothetical protein
MSKMSTKKSSLSISLSEFTARPCSKSDLEKNSMNKQNNQGQNDDFKIWNYGLTNEQIKMEYNSGAVHFQ